MRARYFDPNTGQFISRDPAVATTGSPYNYTGGNPLNSRDPSGLDAIGSVVMAYVNFSAGVLDTVTMGATRPLTKHFGLGICSPAYFGGAFAATLVGIVSGAGAAANGVRAMKSIKAAQAIQKMKMAPVAENEIIAPTRIKPQLATSRWEEFLGEGELTNIHPRTGLPDPDRIVSADGLRSVRFGPHEMNSPPNKFHYHEETWSYDEKNEIWHLGTLLQRVG
jgi:uncharacterized protein RhaS with RHS repeats